MWGCLNPIKRVAERLKFANSKRWRIGWFNMTTRPSHIMGNRKPPAKRSCAIAYVKIDGFLCERCAHHRILKQPGRPEPKVCPNRKSRQWNQPRIRQPKADPYRNDPTPARN